MVSSTGTTTVVAVAPGPVNHIYDVCTTVIVVPPVMPRAGTDPCTLVMSLVVPSCGGVYTG